MSNLVGKNNKKSSDARTHQLNSAFKTMKIIKTTYFVFLFVLLFSFNEQVYSQQQSYQYLSTWPQFDSARVKYLAFRIENANFFRNDEYTSPIVDGYTLIGLWGRFLMEYYPAENLRVRFGGHFLKYHGRESIDDVESIPYYSIQYNPLPDLEIIFGNFDNSQNLGLLEMLYEPEFYYTRKPPGGLQVRFQRHRLHLESWINWETHIFAGDPFQEVFTNGSLISYDLIKKERHKLSVPLQFIYHHQGGEIDSTDAQIETLMNGASGLKYNYKKGDWSLGVSAWYLGYREATSNNLQVYSSGHAGLARIIGGYKRSVLSIGYWNGNRFISPKGRKIYQSYSFSNPGKLYPRRQLLEGRMAMQIPVKYGVTFAIEGDVYYDLREADLSYCWGIHLMFSESFFLKNFK